MGRARGQGRREGRGIGFDPWRGILVSLAVWTAAATAAEVTTSAASATNAARTPWWSLQPVVRPAVPAVHDASASLPIDAFIAAKLEAKQLRLGPEADRRTMIRRLYLVMQGLPPTPEEVTRFVNDTRPDAWERLVDQVLASPRYGERWARHWLDIVRYADSNGFETNRERRNAHPYRDYVIQSFNADKPYDQFIREQIAGDVFGADAGTGFLVAGAFDIVKSPDINLTLMQRQDELADIVNTTGTVFLGLTLGCARCHDHKFDPISQKDYYAVQAVFAGVQFAERPLRPRLSPADAQMTATLRSELKGNETAFNQLRQKAEASKRTSLGGKTLRAPVNARSNEDSFAATDARFIRLTILAATGGEPCLDELEVFDTRGTNVALASLGAKATASGTLPGYAIHKLEHLNDGRHGNSHSWISDTPGHGWVQIKLPEPHPVQRVVWGRDREEKFKDRLATEYRIEVASEPGQWREVASSQDREPLGSDAPEAYLRYLSKDDAARAKELQSALQKTRTRITELTTGPSAWLGTFAQPEPVHRLNRGDPLQKREVVAPDAPAIFGSLALTLDESEQHRRVRLAEWIASPTHPLTARVLVNRLWHHVFGNGLVDTPSDFGRNGTAPTHPELLDWLADEFVRSGWSIKQMQKAILLSRTFRQSSTPRPEAMAVDASARLLWRFSPRRLEAEAMRDGILAASGALDLRMGGPGFYLQKVEEDNVYRYFPRENLGPGEFRRMVYLTRIRQEQDSVFGAFDCPSGNQVMPKRARSNTPLQALNLFNSPFVLQQAELLAARLQGEVGTDPARQVQRAFKIFYGRLPDAVEREASVAMIGEQGLTAFGRALFNTSEFLFVF